MTPYEILETDKVQEWLSYLEAHPEKQGHYELGRVTEDCETIMSACCLGAYLMVVRPDTLSFKEGPVNMKRITDHGVYGTLDFSYKDLYLRDEVGKFVTIPSKGVVHQYFPRWEWNPYNSNLPESLGDLNDNGATWPEIAKFIRAFPSQIFIDHKKQ